MKVVIGALAASMFLALAASAQPTAPAATAPAAPAVEAPPSRCQNPPNEPTLPDGANASDRAIVAANDAYMTWARAVRTSAECKRAEFDEVAAQRRAKAQAHDALNARLREVSARWAEQRNLYCARPRRQCRTIGEAELIVPQSAQTGPCAETLSAPEPVIPEGATANQQAMDAADAAYLAWGSEVQRNMQCRRAEFERLTAISNVREAEHNRLAQRLAEFTSNWDVERTEYCARPRKHCQTTEAPQ
jgi:hypothetical protein